jgi:formylglycine-generating enzyme required for sulfatase activity
MVRNIQLTAGILSGFIFLSSACQSLNIPGNKINTSNTPLVSETPAIPTEIPPTPTITEIPPTPTQENYKVSEIDNMEMIYITGGEFIMGTEDIEAQRILEGNGRQYPETPMHKVTLDGFWIDKFEVTNGQYAKCVESGACEPAKQNNAIFAGDEYYTSPEYANYPVINVTWYKARAYCAWAGRRLPTEAEWEKAARGTDGRKYTWGNEPVSSDVANFCDKYCTARYPNPKFNDGFPETAPVGSFPKGASPYGVMDMAGNVWEWTSSIPMPYPYNPTDGREAKQDVKYDSKWPERVWRGGTWTNGYSWLRASLRYRSVANYWNNNLGFRCAASK